MAYTPKNAAQLRAKSETPAEILARELALIATEIGNDQALASGKIIVGNASGVATDVTMSGDATLSNAGALTIAAEAVTVGKMADLTRGSIITGQDDDRPLTLDAKTSGQILVGNGTDLASVAVSGGVTLAANGAVTIAAGAVEESMLAAANTEGLHAARIARAVYDFSIDGGVIGDIALGATLPDKARVTKSWCEVITPLTSATNAATVAISIPTNDVAGIFAAIAISDVSNPWAAGIHVGIQDGVIANISEKCTAARALTMTIAVEALTAGKIVFFSEYVVSA